MAVRVVVAAALTAALSSALRPSRPHLTARATALGSELAETKSESTALAVGLPKVITIDPCELLVESSVPVGLLYRDALLVATGLMLPRPDVFQDAFDAAKAAAPPRFGAGVERSDAWWRRVTLATYDAVLRNGLYDDDELAAFDKAFDGLFDELQGSLLVGPEAWDVAPDAPRLLAALREWRDLGGGPRVAAVSTSFDERLPLLLENLLGADVVASTFDFVVAATEGDASPFEAAGAKHGVDAAACVHVSRAPAPGCPCAALLVDTGEPVNELRHPEARTSLLDLLDDWNLPREDGDDIVLTSRAYSVYDAEPVKREGPQNPLCDP